jgi:hypothetical protein
MMVLDKLVALHCRDKDLLSQLGELACDNAYAATMSEVERCAMGGTPDPTLPEAPKLYRQIVDRDVLDIFRDGPELSKVEPDDLLVLMKFADVQPDSKTMFRTADLVFMRLADLSKQGPVVIEELMLDDFCQLAMLALHFPHLWDDLHELAQGTGWTEDMLAIEVFLSDQRTLPARPAAASFAQAAAAAVFPDGTPLANIILTPPRFSAMLAEEVFTFEGVRPQLPDPESLIDKQFTPNPSPSETGRILAKHAFEQLPEDTKDRARLHVAAPYVKGIDAASHLRQARYRRAPLA